jgi:hypothetical protein
MYRQSLIPTCSTLRSLAGAAAIVAMAAALGPAAFIMIWFGNASLYLE